MKRLLFVAMSAALLAGAGCFRNPISEMELHVPAMAGEECVARVMAALEPLVEKSDDLKPVVDLDRRVITVRYRNEQLGRRNLEVAVAEAGFDVNDWPANAEAKAALPEGCRGE